MEGVASNITDTGSYIFLSLLRIKTTENTFGQPCSGQAVELNGHYTTFPLKYSITSESQTHNYSI